MSGGVGRCKMPCGGWFSLDFELAVKRPQYTVSRHNDGQVVIDWAYVCLRSSPVGLAVGSKKSGAFWWIGGRMMMDGVKSFSRLSSSATASSTDEGCFTSPIGPWQEPKRGARLRDSAQYSTVGILYGIP